MEYAKTFSEEMFRSGTPIRIELARTARISASPPKLPNFLRHLRIPRQDRIAAVCLRQSFKMAPSNLPAIFNPTSQDIEMLLAAQCHLGSKNLQVHMEPYLWKTRPDGINVINIGKTWEKIVLAARIIVAIDNPADSTCPHHFQNRKHILCRQTIRDIRKLEADRKQSVSSPLARTVSVPSSSSLLTPVPSPSLVASPPVTSPTTSPARSRSRA